MITLEQAKALKRGQIIYQIDEHNKDGSRKRWRVNGKVQTWKTNPNRIKIPIKHGIRHYGYLTEQNLDIVSLNPKGE